MSDELTRLIESEKAALSTTRLFRAFIAGYVVAGGHVDALRQICVLTSKEYTEKRLASTDLPGPDSLKPYIIPKVTEAVAESIGQLFDDLSQGRQLG